MSDLVTKALEIRGRAYVPYSRFQVGAALLDCSGNVYQGCNVENASYGLTVCAERVAVFSAVAAGASSFEAICVATGASRLTAPCGACRQVLWEMCGDIRVILVNQAGSEKECRLSELLPLPFDETQLPSATD